MVGTEGLCPAFRGQLMDEVMWVRGDPKEDVLHVGEGRGVDEFAALDQEIEERRATGTLEAASKRAIFPTAENTSTVRGEQLSGGPRPIAVRHTRAATRLEPGRRSRTHALAAVQATASSVPHCRTLAGCVLPGLRLLG